MRVDGFTPRGFDRSRFEAALPEPYRLLWLAGVDTGLRISDLLTMRVCDIQRLRDGITVTESKTGQERTVKLSTATVSALVAHTAAFDGGAYIWGSPTKHGQPRHRGSVWRVYVKAAADANITKNIGTHSARKTFAQKLYAKTDLETVQETLRHMYPSTTLVYVMNPRTRPRKK